MSEEQLEEAKAWVDAQLADGGTITKAEAKEAIQSFADKHGFKISKKDWEEMDKAFDWVDTSGDGEIDKAEFDAAMEEAVKWCKKNPEECPVDQKHLD